MSRKKEQEKEETEKTKRKPKQTQGAEHWLFRYNRREVKDKK